MTTLYSSKIESLPLVATGKVRDVYAVGNDHLLMIATDRLSAFDVVMNEPVPNKGEILNRISNYWFLELDSIIPNHLTKIDACSVVKPAEMIQVHKRAVVVKRLRPIRVESVVRGYLAGSAWKEYQTYGTVAGVWMPTFLQFAEKLPEPIFSPAIKEASGFHDVNITYAELENFIGKKRAADIRDVSIKLYQSANKIALDKGMILADAKFEFGLDDGDELVLMDEILTPDSSRYWSLDDYQIGKPIFSFDKQIFRDWLESTEFMGGKWNKKAPPPVIPTNVLQLISQRYSEVSHRLGLH